jgi:LmbE family N-acetylglucosaminyl deacetylase
MSATSDSPKRIVFLSPHLDDAVLACGGLISALGRTTSVEVWTLFSSAPRFGPWSPVANWLHAESGGISGSRLAKRRRQEDAKACASLGARFRHFRWKEAAYRRDSSGFLYSRSRQDVIHETDRALSKTIMDKLRAGLKADDVLVAPLGVGKHVDHILTRNSADGTGHRAICYYADFPYRAIFPGEVGEFSASMPPATYVIQPVDVERWIGAIDRYDSQIPLLEKEAGRLRSIIEQEVEHGGLQLFGAGTRKLAGHQPFVT